MRAWAPFVGMMAALGLTSCKEAGVLKPLEPDPPPEPAPDPDDPEVRRASLVAEIQGVGQLLRSAQRGAPERAKLLVRSARLHRELAARPIPDTLDPASDEHLREQRARDAAREEADELCAELAERHYFAVMLLQNACSAAILAASPFGVAPVHCSVFVSVLM
jgi:hypothetical protein